jgi:NADH-quinone oxidoreductase subunit A
LTPIASTPVVLWPMAVYAGAVIALVAAMIGVSYLLGQRHQGRAKGDPYEGGIIPTGPARLRFSVKYYLVAVFFVVFDLEAAFLFAWAVAAREAGWAGYVEALVFIGVLLVALVYLWRQGALDWSPPRRRSSATDRHAGRRA